MAEGISDENMQKIAREFRENKDKILDLEPKDVKDVGISRTTFWIEKEKIENGKYDRISDKIKIKILSVLKSNYDSSDLSN